MKVSNVHGRVHQSGDVSTVKAHGMKSSPIAFKIISSGLYSDKSGAIVRELSSNAMDSHIEAGIPDVPFIIVAPTTDAPTLIIKDMGVGLDEEGFNKVYTTYFESTKTHDADLIGGFGLGAKTPFCYTDNYTVVTIKDGIRRMFSVFIDESGYPASNKVHEAETDEPNGVEVHIAIKRDDIDGFNKSIVTELGNFKTKPEIQGNAQTATELKNNAVRYGIGGDRWKLRDNKCRRPPRFSNYNVHLLNGPVAYPVDVTLLNLSESQTKILRELPIDLHINLVAEEIAASREALSYGKTTIAKISAVMVQVINDVRKNGAIMMEAAGNTLAAKRMYDLITGANANISLSATQQVEATKKQLPTWMSVYQKRMRLIKLRDDMTEDDLAQFYKIADVQLPTEIMNILGLVGASHGDVNIKSGMQWNIFDIIAKDANFADMTQVSVITSSISNNTRIQYELYKDADKDTVRPHNHTKSPFSTSSSNRLWRSEDNKRIDYNVEDHRSVFIVDDIGGTIGRKICRNVSLDREGIIFASDKSKTNVRLFWFINTDKTAVDRTAAEKFFAKHGFSSIYASDIRHQYENVEVNKGRKEPKVDGEVYLREWMGFKPLASRSSYWSNRNTTVSRTFSTRNWKQVKRSDVVPQGGRIFYVVTYNQIAYHITSKNLATLVAQFERNGKKVRNSFNQAVELTYLDEIIKVAEELKLMNDNDRVVGIPITCVPGIGSATDVQNPMVDTTGMINLIDYCVERIPAEMRKTASSTIGKSCNVVTDALLMISQTRVGSKSGVTEVDDIWEALKDYPTARTLVFNHLVRIYSDSFNPTSSTYTFNSGTSIALRYMQEYLINDKVRSSMTSNAHQLATQTVFDATNLWEKEFDRLSKLAVSTNSTIDTSHRRQAFNQLGVVYDEGSTRLHPEVRQSLRDILRIVTSVPHLIAVLETAIVQHGRSSYMQGTYDAVSNALIREAVLKACFDTTKELRVDSKVLDNAEHKLEIL